MEEYVVAIRSYVVVSINVVALFFHGFNFRPNTFPLVSIYEFPDGTISEFVMYTDGITLFKSIIFLIQWET